MVLQDDNSPPTIGQLPVGKAFSRTSPGTGASYRLGWGKLDPGAVGSILTVDTADITGAGGTSHTGLVWTAAPALTSATFTGGIATHGVATPPAQAAFAGTAVGTDATVLNAVVAALVALGLMAAS